MAKKPASAPKKAAPAAKKPAAKAAAKPASKAVKAAPNKAEKPEKAEKKPVAKKEPVKKVETTASAGKKSSGSAKKPAASAKVETKSGVPEKKPSISVVIAPKTSLVASVRIEKPQAAKPAAAVAEQPGSDKKLTAKELREFRDRLIEMRDRITSNIRSEINDTDKSMKGDEGDIANDFAENAVYFEMARSGSKALIAIENALQRINDGTYGICESCDCCIPKSRLWVLPFATMCMNCKKKDPEQTESGETTVDVDEDGDWEISEGAAEE
mgnify:CR=1 FL=1